MKKIILFLFTFILSGCYRCAGKSGYSAYCFDDDTYSTPDASCYYRITDIDLRTGRKEYKIVKDIDSAIYYYNYLHNDLKCEERTFKKLCGDYIVLLEVEIEGLSE